MTLEAELSRWRAEPTLERANRLDALAADVPVPDAPTHEAFSQQWLAACGAGADAETLVWLSKTLVERLAVVTAHAKTLPRLLRKHAAFFARIEALQRLEPSPFLAQALCRTVERALFSAIGTQECLLIYRPLVEALVRQRDVRVLPRLEQLARVPSAKRGVVRDALSQLLPPAIEVMSTWPEAELARRASQSVAMPRDAAALWSAVCAAPDDDGPLLVLADWLQEQGDVRGDFIARSVRAHRGPPNAKEEKALRALQRTHQKTWLGDLAPVLTHVVFERGLLHRAEVARNAAASTQGWSLAAQSRELQVVRGLTKGLSSAANLFLLASKARHLESVDIADAAQVMEWAEGPATKLRAVRFLGALSNQNLEAFSSAPAFSALETLEVSVVRTLRLVAMLRDSPLLEKLKTLRLDIHDARLLADTVSLVRVGGPELVFTLGSASARVTRGSKGVEVSCNDGDGPLTRAMLNAFAGAQKFSTTLTANARNAAIAMPVLAQLKARSGTE